MTYSRSFQNYRPPRRYDGNPWTSALIYEAAAVDGAFSLIDTITLSPADSNPANPILRSFTTDNALLADAWYRVNWQDAALATSADGTPVHAGAPSPGSGRTAALLTRLNSLAGLDLTDDEGMELLIEGSRELCARAEWLRGTVEFGPTVPAQSVYTVPDNVDRMLRVSVAGVPYSQSDEWAIEWVNDSELELRYPNGSGAYYETTDELGTPAISLYPVPTAGGDAISVKAVLVPPDVSDSQDPSTPARFDRYIEAFAAARAFETLEDNPEDASVYYNRFEAGVNQLNQLRVGRTGREPFQARVVGITI